MMMSLFFTRNPETVCCGWTHVVALKAGRFYSWGRNNYYQCGADRITPTEPLNPEQGSKLTEIRKVVSGSEHCLALDGSGDVFSWGWNEHGNCGTGTVQNIPTPIKIVFDNKICDIFVGSAHCFASSE